jgi:hypothetical protein
LLTDRNVTGLVDADMHWGYRTDSTRIRPYDTSKSVLAAPIGLDRCAKLVPNE